MRKDYKLVRKETRRRSKLLNASAARGRRGALIRGMVGILERSLREDGRCPGAFQAKAQWELRPKVQIQGLFNKETSVVSGQK